MGYTLEQLYDMQDKLDARIIAEKGLEGVDLLLNTVLALQVENAELANEWRGFKHWSNDQEPRTRKETPCPNDCDMFAPCGCELCDENGMVIRNPLLEEYVDCLHFLLSIARQLGISANELTSTWDEPTEETTILFIDLITAAGLVDTGEDAFEDAWSTFNQIGTRLGLDWDQITAAYVSKNAINHQRQANGY